MTAAQEPPIRVFLSYAHADDVVLEFVEPFKASLKHMALADQGRRLDIFIDRDSIGWGENWQNSIRTAIDGATVFMPVITWQYFERQACVEELLTFYTEAHNLGVTSLLLPVVILGHSQISEGSSNAAARIVHDLQYKDFKEAMIEGPQSSIWRRTMVKLAEDLVKAASNAERTLSLGQLSPSTPHPIGNGSTPEDSDEDAPGMAEVGDALESFGERSQTLATSLAGDMAAFVKALSGADKMKGLPKPELRNYVLEVAIELQPIGEHFSKTGSEFEAVALETDRILRSYLRYLRDNGTPEQIEGELDALRSAADSMDEIVQAEQAISQFLENLRPMEVSSAPLRKSLRGFRDGARAMTSGIRIIQSWPSIADE